MTQALALRRSFHQAGDVGHDELRPVAHTTDPDDSEMRLQRGERIVGDLRLGRRDVEISVDLPALGKPTRATSAMSLSSMSSQNSWPFSACSANAGRGGGWREAGVPPTTLSALGHHEARAFDVEVHTTEPLRSRTTVPTGRVPPDLCPGPRASWMPDPCTPSVAGGTGGPGNRAATPRSPRPRAIRRHRDRRRPHRGHHGPHGPPCATTPPRLPLTGTRMHWAWSTKPGIVAQLTSPAPTPGPRGRQSQELSVRPCALVPVWPPVAPAKTPPRTGR